MLILPTGCWQMKVTHLLIIMKTQFPPTDPTQEELSRQVAFSPVRKSHGKAAGIAQSKGLEMRVCVVKWYSRDATRVRIGWRSQKVTDSQGCGDWITAFLQKEQSIVCNAERMSSFLANSIH